MNPNSNTGVKEPRPRGLVTVIIAARNASGTIARAVRSALGEREVSEVLVIDDASSDDTAEVARACDDGRGRLTVMTLPHNVGPAAARNLALARCRSEWVAVLDADDFFLPGRITRLLAHAPDADLVADDLLQVDEGAEDARPVRMIGNKLTDPVSLDLATFVRENLARRGRLRKELGLLKPLLRRSFLTSHELRYREDLRLGEDYELYARSLALGARFLLVPPQGYVSVSRAGSLSDRHGEDDLYRLRECDRALAQMRGITRRERRALDIHYKNVDAKLQWRRLITALKARDLTASLSPFVRSWPVTRHLIANLATEVGTRARRRSVAAMTALVRW